MGIGRIKHIAKRKGYLIYNKPYQLNIWGIRSCNEKPNRFDDELHVFYVEGKNSGFGRKKWTHYVFPITTDPGTYWLNNPMSPQGTAMLAPGQYRDTYKLDLHRGKYYALCQRLAKVTVIRDFNRDAILDFRNGTPDRGMFGINIHRARKTGTTYTVDNHSAGCQVFQRVQDFDLFMRLCEMHRDLYGNQFTYTLIDQRMEFKAILRRTTMGIIGLGALVGVYLSTLNNHPKTVQNT